MRISSQNPALWALVIIALLAACATGQSNDPHAAMAPNPSQRTTDATVMSNQPIRSVDFANFTFPSIRARGEPAGTFTLRGGELDPTRDQNGMVDEMGVTLQSAVYGDLTGDGGEEALVVLSLVTGGSAIPHATYVYGVEDGTPKVLWAFSSGDRAGGGLRRVYAENGELVIERYSPLDAKGDCCPTLFTRARYKWQGNRFRQDGQEGIMANPEGHGGLIMPTYQRK